MMVSTRGLIVCLTLAIVPLPLHAATGGKAGKVDRMLKKAITDSAKDAPTAITPSEPPAPEPDITEDTAKAPPAESAPAPTPMPEPVTTEMPAKDPMVFGNMRFQPALGIQAGYDDNVQAANTREDGDLFAVLTPEVHAEFVGGRNDFSIDLLYEARRYLDEDDENINKFMASLQGVIKGQSVEIPYSARYISDREDRREDLLRQIPNEPIKTRTFGGEIGIRTIPEQQPLGFALTGRVTQFQFDNGRTENGVRVVRADADHETWEAEGRVSYDFMPGHSFSLSALYGVNDYENRAYQGGSFSGPERDSDRYAAWLGWTMNAGPLTGSTRLGFEHRTYDNATIEDISNMLAALDLNWAIDNSTSLSFAVDHGHYEDDEVIDPIMETRARITAEQKLSDRIWLTGGGAYQYRDFEGSNREDDTVSVTAGASYQLTDKLTFGADYSFETRDSDLAAADYDRNLYMLRVRGEL